MSLPTEIPYEVWKREQEFYKKPPYEKFKVGDTVTLAGHSTPIMVVIAVCQGYVKQPITTKWFVNGVSCEDTFPEEALKKKEISTR